MKNAIIILIVLLGFSVNAQTLTEKLLVTDTNDSLLLKSSSVNFDKQGNYCFEVKKDNLEYLLTNTDTLGGFEFIGTTFGDGEIKYTNRYNDPEDTPYYYKNGDGTQVFGMAVGKRVHFETSGISEHIAMVTELRDSVYFYIDDTLVQQRLKNKDHEFWTTNEWVAFSENGNVIYYLKQDDSYILYVNDKVIDSSKFEYNQLAINNAGNYIYAQGNKPQKPIGEYNYMYYIHTNDTVLDYVRTVWKYELKPNGAYYYSGNDNESDYVAVNNKLFRNLYNVANITLIDKNNFLFTYEDESGAKKMNVNGTVYTNDFEEIYYPTMDAKGNFAFYGLKNYYLYKVINDKQRAQPLSNYGVRAKPVYISPEGKSIHYFKTDDSIYVYQDNKLLCDPRPIGADLNIKSSDELFHVYSGNSKTANGNSLFYLEDHEKGYLVFNGQFSKPVLPIIYSDQLNGAIISGAVTDDGFFAIQKVGAKKYLVIVNNTTYYEVENIDKIIKGSYFFDENELVFYGVKGSSFYQFKLSL